MKKKQPICNLCNKRKAKQTYVIGDTDTVSKLCLKCFKELSKYYKGGEAVIPPPVKKITLDDEYDAIAVALTHSARRAVIK
jgi:hypothetical protein